jgi:cellulose synthase/poly-beta-1,6-N-acetylglucosamine synthase-like glycosyltransferase
LIQVLHILLYLLIGIPVSFFFLYGILLVAYYRKKTGSISDSPSESVATREFEPTVSVVVATHNEEGIISKKIENLLASNYPKDRLEIVFADDSDDSTPEIISDYAKKTPNLKLLRFSKRMGYSPSMMAGCETAKGDIIVLNDAGSFLDPLAIANLVARFKSGTIGVVSGKDVILNTDEDVGKSETLYQRMYDFLRTSETNMDSTFYVKGEATGIRHVLLDDMNVPMETFDTTIGLIARQKGYRVVYDPSVRFYEYAPATHLDRIRQKTIRAANLIKVLWRFRHMLLNRKYGKYGLLIMPANFTMLILVPIIVVSWIAGLCILTVFEPGFCVPIWAVLSIAFLASLVISKRIAVTFFEFEYSLLKAIYQVVFTRKTHDKIDKVASTRRLT